MAQIDLDQAVTRVNVAADVLDKATKFIADVSNGDEDTTITNPTPSEPDSPSIRKMVKDKVEAAIRDGDITGSLPIRDKVAVSTTIGAAHINGIIPVQTVGTTSLTMTLPTAPTLGTLVGFIDYDGNWSKAGIRIKAADLLSGSNKDIVLQRANMCIVFQFIDATQGWKVIYGTPGQGDVDWVKVDSDSVLERGLGYWVDTSTANTEMIITLPADPAVDDIVGIGDYNGSFGVRGCRVVLNGKKFMGQSENLILETSNLVMLAQYVDDTIGWKIISGVGLGGAGGDYLSLETASETFSNPNLLSNHNFLVPSPDAITHPSSTPTDYMVGTQIFSGVFVGSNVVGLTYINGRVKWDSGTIYFVKVNAGGLEYVTQFVASVADFDGKPRMRGVSFALIGDEYRVTVGVDALEDESANATPLGSVKFEQGDVATGHEVQSAKGQVYTFGSVAEMVSIGAPIGSLVKTTAYHGGWVAKLEEPVGGAEYVIVQGNRGDDIADHNIGGTTAILIIRNGEINVDQCGARGDYFSDHDQQTVNLTPTDDTKAFQAAVKKAFHIKMSDRIYYAEDTHGLVDVTFIDNGTARSQYRITGASRMRSGVYYNGSGTLFKCESRGGSNTYFEHFRMKNIMNETDSSSSIVFKESTSVAVKLESATRVTFNDVHIQGFGNGIFAENVYGAWCEFLSIKNSELFRNLINIPLRVNGGTDSFHGLNTEDLIIHTVPNGYGFSVGEGCYIYNAKISCGFFGTGNPSEVSWVMMAGAGGNSNCEQTEFAIWSERGGKVVIEDGAKVDGEGYWHEHTGPLVIEDANTDDLKGFLVFDHGNRTWSSKQPSTTSWGRDTISRFSPGLSAGASPLAGVHAVDGAGRSTVLAATNSSQSGVFFAFGDAFYNLVPKSYIDNFGAFHPNESTEGRFSYTTSAPAQGSSSHGIGSIVQNQGSQRDIDARPAYSYTADTDGATPFALALQPIYASGTRPSSPITGQAMWYAPTSEPSWNNGSGWVEATVSASDATLKTDPEEITDNECLAALEMKLVKFKMLDSVAEKGDSARYHYGVIAQQCIGVLENYGIDINTFAPILHTPVFDDDGNLVSHIWKVRYQELLVMRSEAIARRISGLI
ncbi:pectin lyase fold/virulence factor [Vibrio phage 1.244.A._10N.261.54.C3]|nr:pectin lyase fold/virulence factor [Vibrio phage 1.244.A._10N.261.54.C3]AUR98750.1 pectin lyase fold/virulence factor [Vibrio phage 1.255.O._10N.286.45.F1]